MRRAIQIDVFYILLCCDLFTDKVVTESAQSQEEVNNIQSRSIEIHRRSLPETPAQQLQHTPSRSPMLSRPVSLTDAEDRDSYTELTESSEDDLQRTCCGGWREAINSAGEDELRALLSNVVSTLETGLRPNASQSQTYCNLQGSTSASLVYRLALTVTFSLSVSLYFNTFMLYLYVEICLMINQRLKFHSFTNVSAVTMVLGILFTI